MDYEEELVRGELKRLTHGLEFDACPPGFGLVDYNIRCPGRMEEAAAKIRDAMISIALNSLRDSWPDREEWSALLPGWFVDACAPERSEEESKRWLKWWDGLDWDQKQREAQRPKPWSLEGWLHWFSPEMRTWYWWRGEILDESNFRLSIMTQEWPPVVGALAWLVRAAGATMTEED